MNKTNSVVLRKNNMCAYIDLAHGANCTDFYDGKNNIHLLYSSDNRYLNGMPILFPANRISGGRFTAGGYTYFLPVNEIKTGCALHGEMSNLPFAAVSQSEDEVLCRREFKGDYPGFPQHFCVEIVYKITDDSLIQTLRVSNYSEIPLPLMFGFHTTFAIPFCEGSSAEDIRIYADIDRVIERGSDRLPTDVSIISDDFSKDLQKGEAMLPEKISIHYLAGSDGKMSLFDTRTGILAVYELDGAFRYRMVFTANKEKYLCLEPQVCVTNAPNAPLDKKYTHIPLLSKGKTAEFKSKIFLSKAECNNFTR
ncbi:MAG: aldose 1-epimerase [Clostridia bacterium]|nr:aldose 1-epimerase [Clostridia bacterium]